MYVFGKVFDTAAEIKASMQYKLIWIEIVAHSKRAYRIYSLRQIHR